MSTHLGLFYATLLYRAHCTLIFIFLCSYFLKVFFVCKQFYWIRIIFYQIYLTHGWHPHRQILPLWIKVDLRIMSIKGHYTLLKSSELEAYHHILFRVKTSKLFLGVESLTPLQEIQYAYSKPYRQEGNNLLWNKVAKNARACVRVCVCVCVCVNMTMF